MAEGIDDIFLEEIFHGILHFEAPAVIAVVYHIPGHTAVNADVFAGNEPRLIGT